jgi:hypothetical protein
MLSLTLSVTKRLAAAIQLKGDTSVVIFAPRYWFFPLGFPSTYIANAEEFRIQ